MPLIYAEGSCYSFDKQTKNGSIFNVDIGIVQFCYVCTFKMIKGKQEMSMSLWIKACYHNCTTFTKPIRLLMSSKI